MIAINDYLRLKIRVGCVGNFGYQMLLLIEFIMPNLGQIYLCIPEIFKTYDNKYEPKDYFVVKKQC